jgi:hypothetical protein
MNRPGESGDSGCCLADLDESGVLTVIGGLKLGGRDVAAGFVEPLVAEPVDAVQGGQFDLLSGAPGPGWQLDPLAQAAGCVRIAAGEPVIEQAEGDADAAGDGGGGGVVG